MPIRYTRVGWQDAPSTDTPIDAANLNHMDNGILALSEEVDTELPLLQEQINDISTDIDTQIDEKVPPEVSSWLTEHVDPVGSAVVVDDTLSIQGAAADAKKTGDEISDLKDGIGDLSELETEEKSSLVGAINEARGTGGSGGSGLTEDVKVALLDCFEHVAWIDEHGQDYYDALEDALYPPANLTRITAVYTQSGAVYDNQTLDSLKSDLVVRAIYDNGTSEAVTNYMLSGTLATGTSTITVSYGGKTTTFTVTVTHAVAQYSITNNLTNCTNSNSATVVNEETEYSGTLTVTSGYIMSAVTITMGGIDVTSTAYDSETGAISIASVTGNVVITAEAVEDVGWIDSEPYQLTWTNGKSVNASTGEEQDSGSYSVTDYIPCHGATAFEYTQTGTGVCTRVYYDENHTFISGSGVSNYAQTGYFMIPDGAYYAKISLNTNAISKITLTPHLYPMLNEHTVWESGKIYRFAGVNNLMFCFGATTATLTTEANVSGYRGYYSLYDASKARTNDMTTTNKFHKTPLAIESTDYYFSVWTDANAQFLVVLT